MRAWLYDAVLNCPAQAATTGNRIFTTGSVEGPTPVPEDIPDKPFIVIRFAVKNNVGMPGSTVKQQHAQVWIHDDPGSMNTIDGLTKELEEWLPSQAPAAHGSDKIMDCRWEDTSSDGYDDHYKTSTRYVTVLVTFREG